MGRKGRRLCDIGGPQFSVMLAVTVNRPQESMGTAVFFSETAWGDSPDYGVIGSDRLLRLNTEPSMSVPFTSEFASSYFSRSHFTFLIFSLLIKQTAGAGASAVCFYPSVLSGQDVGNVHVVQVQLPVLADDLLERERDDLVRLEGSHHAELAACRPVHGRERHSGGEDAVERGG